MPTLNALWAKYGCDKCDKYGCLIIEVDPLDAKNMYANYIASKKITVPCVSMDDGGTVFDDALDNYGAGGRTFLIKPDKTFKECTRYLSENDLTSAGIKAHVCSGVSIKTAAISQNSSISCKSIHNTLHITVPQEGVYSLFLYTANGQKRIVSDSKFFSAGLNTINLSAERLSPGFYMIEIVGNDHASLTRKLVVTE